MGDAEAATTLAALVTTLATSLERVNTTLRSGFVSMTDAITSTSTGAKSATTPGNAVSRARSRRRGSTRHRVVSHTMGVSGARRAGVIDPTAARRADGADNGRGLRQNHKRVFLAANATLQALCAVPIVTVAYRTFITATATDGPAYPTDVVAFLALLDYLLGGEVRLLRRTSDTSHIFACLVNLHKRPPKGPL